ncbi:NADP oxidoreductase [Dictyobacter kobayashii]|uniref:Oxidoreductase n=1 Tax=Dictyobacter kobayashii TaxID=2014872 RepID=A0A402AQ49_9CHLR|nr:NADP oxidoreductase [Dictyobacter kobayashii]GCE21159.1 oxidoreductase [Dictyobacter kobayashii]
MSTQPTTKVSVATVWLDGCSGCHMSFLDMDERLIELASSIDIVYSPLVDTKIFPEQVDLTLVEGSVSSEDDLAKIKNIREHTRLLISMGDCAVTGNVPSLRNPLDPERMLRHIYLQHAPSEIVPRMLPRVLPVHQVVAVDAFLPGCPPSADVLYFALTELLAGRLPDVHALTRFGK